MIFRYLPWLGAVIGFAAPPAVQAQQGIQLETQMFVERVSTDINGRARRILTVPGNRIARGDQVIFVVNWRNQGARPVHGFAVTNPVPGTVRIDPAGSAMQVSVDGGAHWGRLDQVWLPTSLGGTRRATPEDVTHIRWTMAAPVSPGERGRISYRGTVR
jgi:hypothetical protein